MSKKNLPAEQILRKIFIVRGEKVMLDEDLAVLYGVPTGRLNEAVKRNIERFPDDFLFKLTKEEDGELRSQIAISNAAHGGRRYERYVFTEQGVAMLSGVLRSERAVAVNIEIMRTFVRLRQMLGSNAELAKKLLKLESQYDEQFRAVFDAIRSLMEKDDQDAKKPKKRIGYHP